MYLACIPLALPFIFIGVCSNSAQSIAQIDLADEVLNNVGNYCTDQEVFHTSEKFVSKEVSNPLDFIDKCFDE